MPWKEKTVEDLRKEFVKAAIGSNNFSSLCREFGITRATGYKWLERFKQEETLADRSHKPRYIANRTSSETERLILDMRSEHPSWGAKKIHNVLIKKGYKLPCIKTVNNILKRYGCITKEESLKHTAFVRFEKENCNEMWQTDFKGEFKMLDGNYCFPLDIFDDHSRFLIKIKPSINTKNVVIPTFKDVFYEYGMPDSILSDNGAQFAGFKQGYTQFEKWLMNHDIIPIHGRIKHPQTQGKIERLHRTMEQELLNHYTPKDITDAEEALSKWREIYNNERPHEALGMKCPAEVYEPSRRKYYEKVTPYEYSGAYHVLKVNNWGYIRFNNWQVYLSETMIGERIEIRANENEETFVACYRNFIIAEFDMQTGIRINRKIRRLFADDMF